ncbi:ABC transporter substrate-binding protein [Propionibacterium australiense]|uniref:ABC transporter periplasmic binding domain n=1 Tax=Propionibacterium australiense TaxID=119981 RepID=A0A383S843_9ACTN|nr:ABC transporter substrate-binding protein [Propionibacterium australiense]RLP07642.1 ABC transporter substrate-binding protein [Propionibacterium australiense]RLP08067.1 ABC transporter substrate-binding protein [Propionibacterium australiense]SYZ33732.1 ABC transporter periplasmic binding domain [Propionibacterium australiense]VEH92788.1 corrinoid ABC transporter substrate-binding protein [Propionibacterium australiense]
MKKLAPAAAALAATMMLTACGSSAADKAASSASEAGSAAGFPAEVTSCTETLHFDAAPERVVIIGGTSASILKDLGLMDHVVARAGDPGLQDADPDLQSQIEAIPEVESSSNVTGGRVVSTEAILSVRPDLVIGYDSGVERDALRDAGVPLYAPDAFCDEMTLEHATWDNVENEVTKTATIFGVTDKVPALMDEVRGRLDDIEQTAASGQSAAALYLTPGSDVFYAYGTPSMIQPIFEANGLKNAYEDTQERVFDASMEDLLDRNPQWIVLMGDAGTTTEQLTETLMGLNGAADLQAVKDGHVLVLSFRLTDPPNTLSVQGAVRLSQLIGEAQ